jgi:hypothetical protein
LSFSIDVWIRTQRAALASRRATNLATHLPNINAHSPLLRRPIRGGVNVKCSKAVQCHVLASRMNAEINRDIFKKYSYEPNVPTVYIIHYTDKKIFFPHMGSVAKSYMRKGVLLYEEMRKYLSIYEEPLVVYDFATVPTEFS